MPGEHIEADVVVVGAGTAGSNAALQLARTGLRVVMAERRPEGMGGARWCNGVVPWQFERAGLEPPAGAEQRSTGGPVHLLSPSRRHRVLIPASPIWEADMRLLGQRLWDLAADAGVNLLWEVTDLRVQLDGGRPVRITAARRGEAVTLEASLFVDATGRRGVLRDSVPAFAPFCPPVAEHDLCSAQALVVEITDRDGARRWLDEQEAAPGEAVNWVGLSGGYSVQVVTVDPSLDEASLLTGALADGRSRSGPDLMKELRAGCPWMGRPHFGGGALIPLRRTYDRLTAPGVALVGDAACQVMAAHGSGIGYGLIAGKVLAESVAGAIDPGGESALWRYQSRYLREFGPTLGAYDVFRRMSVALGSEGIERLFSTGIFGPDMVEPGLHQQLGAPRLEVLAAQGRALATNPGLARVVAPALARAGMAQALYRGYPGQPSDRALAAWSRATRVALGA